MSRRPCNDQQLDEYTREAYSPQITAPLISLVFVSQENNADNFFYVSVFLIIDRVKWNMLQLPERF